MVFNASSIPTPARPAFNYSTRTPTSADGKGGGYLNDLMAKGRGMSFNLEKILVKFSIGHAGISGDISQFYNVCKLRPEYRHLQIFLWKEALDPDKEVNIAVIKTPIHGNGCSAPIPEEGMTQLAAGWSPKIPSLQTS